MTIYEIQRNLVPPEGNNPGSSGEDVKVLQQWLKDNGFFPKDVEATGYYGNITKSAVEKWQRSISGFDAQGNWGYFGPRSRAALPPQGQAPGAGETPKPPPGTPPPPPGIPPPPSQGTPPPFDQYRFDNDPAYRFATQNPVVNVGGIYYKYTSRGYDPNVPISEDEKRGAAGREDVGGNTLLPVGGGGIGQQNFPYENDPAFKSASQSEQLFMRMMWDTMGMYAEQNKQVGAGKEFTKEDLDKFMEEAKTNPDIQKYYGDQLAMAQRDIENLVGFMKGEYTTAETERQRKFELQKKTLAEQEAEAGRAFSGFREQAKERLGQEQEGIISSSRRQLQRNLYTYGSEFERKIGSAALPSLKIVEGIDYTPYGGVGGEFERAKLLDIESRYRSLVERAMYERGII